MMSSSSTAARTVHLYDSSFSSSYLGTKTVPGTALGKYIFTVDEAGTYYIGSASSGINVYGVYIYYSDTIDTASAITVTSENDATFVEVGSTLQLTATVTMATEGSEFDGTVIWYSSNTSVATVNTSGKVTGVAEGTVTIYACYDGVVQAFELTVTSSETE